MKTIKIQEIKNYRGGAMNVPYFDAAGEVVKEEITGPDGKPLMSERGEPVTVTATKPGTIVDILDFVIMDFPRTRLTMKNIVEANRLVTKLNDSRDRNLDVLELEDATFDWLVTMLKDEEIGVKMFGLSLVQIINAIGAEL